MEYLALILIGLAMGLFGGLLGIGGSIVMIPAMTFIFGENQHLYQASAMLCNFFVALASVVVHRRADSLVRGVLLRLIPAALAGIIVGVAVSNLSVFAGGRSFVLARCFGFFMVYVAVDNIFRLIKSTKAGIASADISGDHPFKANNIFSSFIGLVTGIGAGLLGIGAGTVSTPLQQLLLKMPLKRAMSNSAATITAIALIGALYKNLTLERHGLEIADSLRIAVVIIPAAIAGGFTGGKLMHRLPKNTVRAVFIVVLIAAAYELITVKP